MLIMPEAQKNLQRLKGVAHLGEDKFRKEHFRSRHERGHKMVGPRHLLSKENEINFF
jgi:hypothetical protein